MFAGGRCAGMEEGHYVTLDCAAHFLARGQRRNPARRHVELVEPDRRGHVFLHGVVQAGRRACYSFSGTLKRVRTPNEPA